MKKLPLIGGMLVAAGSLLAWGQPDADVSNDTALNRNIAIFNAITEQLNQVYVDSLRPDEAFELAIAGLLYTVDPYTEFYNTEDVERVKQMTTGAYGGIGAYIHQHEGETYISNPMENSPAAKAGLKAGDHILKVDSVDVRGKGSDFTIRHMKGDPSTMVTLLVERPFVADSLLTIEIMREKLQDKSVPYYGVSDGVGYIKLNSFMEKSADEVKEALESFKKVPGLKGVILDLRDNGGGLVTSSVDILGMFLPKGTKVLETKGKPGSGNNTKYVTDQFPVMKDVPLVVLINEDSASASEITAGAIQDLDRGVLMGRRSFGKGLVQSTLNMPYNTMLKVTTSKYHLPSGRLIQALDYSHRRDDGSVAPTPDSLTNEFKTRHGRKVRDGGGLVPDSMLVAREYSRLISSLLSEDQIFNYANKFASEHPAIPSPGEFKITDEIFNDFVAFIDTTKVKSVESGPKLVEALRKTADTEGFMTEDLDASLKALEPLVAPNLNRDLANKRAEIEEFLGREIVKRYYYTKGETEYGLRFDDEFAAAKKVLADKKLYDSFLSPKK